jgi:hypothetical protein
MGGICMSGDLRTIYVIREVTRYDDASWDLGLPEDVAVEWDEFYFDTKYGDQYELKEQLPLDIERLEELLKLTGHRSLQPMIDARKEWLKEQADYERISADAEALSRERALEAARQLLREAGELPEVSDDPTDPADR